jgi:opacity protein-like surface antigen
MHGSAPRWGIRLFGATALLVLLLVGPASAQPTWFYVRGDVGASFSRDAGGSIDDDLGTATLFNAGIGFKILPFIRTDLTLTYRTGYEIDSNQLVPGSSATTDVTNLTGMLNAYYDFPEFGRFQPYIGFGVGLAYNDVDSVNAGGVTLSGESSTDFAWQVGLGTAIALVPGVAIDLGYRYVDLGEVETGRSGGLGLSGDLTAHEVMAGIRIGF